MTPGTTLLFVISLMIAWLGCAVADTKNEAFADDVGSGSALAPLAPYLEVPRICRNYSMINYLSSFPCTDKEFAEHNESAAAALRLLRRCDVFAFVASELAARHINRHLQGIFTYSGDYLFPDLTLNLISLRGTSVSLPQISRLISVASTLPNFLAKFSSETTIYTFYMQLLQLDFHCIIIMVHRHQYFSYSIGILLILLSSLWPFLSTV